MKLNFSWIRKLLTPDDGNLPQPKEASIIATIPHPTSHGRETKTPNGRSAITHKGGTYQVTIFLDD